MALNQTTAPSSGIWQAIKGVMGLFDKTNKAGGPVENVSPEPEELFKSSLPDEDIKMLIRTWRGHYNTYYNDVEPSQKLSMEYWIGKQRDEDGPQVVGQSLIVNKIFKAVETFIPIATRQNPDPVAETDGTPQGEDFSHAVQVALVHEANRQKLRKLLKRLLRHWLIYRIGIIKVGYDLELEQITTEVINPKRWMGDPNGHFDEFGFFTGEWQAEKKIASADKLTQLFKDKSEDIMLAAKGKKGTKIEYIEWWYKNKDYFFTLNDEIILGKFKNPHWNWDIEPTEEKTDEDGNVIEEAQPGQKAKNYYKEAKAPYIGLNIFSTGLQPHDETSLIIQNIPLQDSVNSRARQIDNNVKDMNNGLVVSSVFTEDQASLAAAALRKGKSIRVPSSVADVRQAVVRMNAVPIPDQVFEHQAKQEQELEDIFGISGSSPNGIDNEDTVRGKIMANQMDSSRIGGGITEYIEQVSETIYTYWIQLMYVHYTEPHYFITTGQIEGSKLVSIVNTDFLAIQELDISVKAGSLIPKDPLTQRNEAIDLWSANAIDPLNFYKRLDFPDPSGMTQSLILWQLVQKGAVPPQAYLPTFQMANMPQAPLLGEQPGTGGPAVSPPPNSPLPQPNAPAPNSPPAVEAQGQELIHSVPA